jgi:hypothetical protein|nr:hypothetical protein [uncultured Dongia sp.]
MTEDEQTIADYCGPNLDKLKADGEHNPDQLIIAQAVEQSCTQYIHPLQKAKTFAEIGAAVSALSLIVLLAYVIWKKLR